ncbi:MAG: entericidin A/B family lipoprotein [Opitutaceae bacterium]
MAKSLQRIIAATLIASLIVLTGCNTMRGLGEDVESLGEKMQNAGE